MRSMPYSPHLAPSSSARRWEYDALVGRLHAYDLPQDVIDDIETYRSYWQQKAYEMGCIHAQMVLGGSMDVAFTDTDFNPFR